MMTTNFFLTVLVAFMTVAAAEAELLNGVCDETFCVCAVYNYESTVGAPTLCPKWMYEAYNSDNITQSVLGNTLLCSYVAASYAPDGLGEVIGGNEVTKNGNTYYEMEVTYTNGDDDGPVILNYTATDPAPECTETAPFPILTISASPTVSPLPPSDNGGCNDPTGVCSSAPTYHQSHVGFTFFILVVLWILNLCSASINQKDDI